MLIVTAALRFGDFHHHDLRPEGFGKVLDVLGETPVSTEPGEGALNHPAARSGTAIGASSKTHCCAPRASTT